MNNDLSKMSLNHVIAHMWGWLDIKNDKEVLFMSKDVLEFGYQRLAQAFEYTVNGREEEARTVLDEWSNFTDQRTNGQNSVNGH